MSSFNMNNSNMYPIEALVMEVEVSIPWQQWQQKSSGDLMVDFVITEEEQHMTLPNARRENENENDGKYRFLPVPASSRSSSISSQYLFLYHKPCEMFGGLWMRPYFLEIHSTKNLESC